MKLKIIAAVLVVGALASTPVRALGPAETVQADFIEVIAATNAALDAQSAFGRARAARDAEGAKDAAADLFSSIGEAVFWSRLLQRSAAEANAGRQVIADAAELNTLANRAFERMMPIFVAGDMAGLERALDESADTLNSLSLVMRRMTRAVGGA